MEVRPWIDSKERLDRREMSDEREVRPFKGIDGMMREYSIDG